MLRQSRVLVVDAGEDRRALAAAFTTEGFEVRSIEGVNGDDGIDEFDPDLLVVDLRHADPVLTVREVTRLVAGHLMGAAAELRGSARARRALADVTPEDIALDESVCRIDLEAMAAFRRGQDLALTTTELALLAILVRHRNAVVSKARLLELVRGPHASNPNVVEVHISSLRRKLELHGPRLIRTVRGVGYTFSVPRASPGKI